ncbi:hypothetical protein [Aurantibacter sp.]|uniref:hypothetical protein n=1 Tax=Aurantibacter sp. TaxID=2807103 RepID=UPI0035C79845
MKSFLLLFILILSSCSSSKSYEEKVNNLVIVEAEFIGENKVLDTLRFDIFEDRKTLSYSYTSISNKKYFNKNTLIEFQLANDSILIYNGKKCSLIDTEIFKFENKNIVVYKYLFDDKNWIDEETEYYFTKEHGLIYSSGLAWSTEFMYNKKYLSEIQDSILRNLYKFKTSIPPTFIKDSI